MRPRLHVVVILALIVSTAGFAKKSAPTRKKKKAAASSSRGFGAAPPARKAVRVSEDVANPKWSAFMQWLDESGAATDAVALTEFKGGLRGVRATRALKQGDEIMRIPRAAILDCDAADASAVGALWRDAEEPLPGYAKLALAVLHECRARNGRDDGVPVVAEECVVRVEPQRPIGIITA